jgi:hypothetical protein
MAPLPKTKSPALKGRDTVSRGTTLFPRFSRGTLSGYYHTLVTGNGVRPRLDLLASGGRGFQRATREGYSEGPFVSALTVPDSLGEGLPRTRLHLSFCVLNSITEMILGQCYFEWQVLLPWIYVRTRPEIGTDAQDYQVVWEA